MNLDLPAARALLAEVREKIGDSPPIDIAVCPSSIYLFPMAKSIAGSAIKMGGQNCWSQPGGAFTGEVSAAMLKETGCSYVILGHSERRHTIGPCDSGGKVHGETDQMIAAKCQAAMAVGLIPIVCVGETLDQRDRGVTEEVLKLQITGSLAGLEVTSAEALVIAYEPVWAIGTGRNATSQQAQEAHRYIRGLLTEWFGPGLADGIRILYGGSVKPDNALDLMSCGDVDGALVGGASLKAADFAAIIQAAIRAKRSS